MHHNSFPHPYKIKYYKQVCTHSSSLVWIVELFICVSTPYLVLIPHVSCNSDIDVVLQQLLHVQSAKFTTYILYLQ